MNKKIFLFLFLFLLLFGFMFTQSAKANCNNIPSKCSDSTKYPICKDLAYVDCQNLGGCFWNDQDGHFCAYKEGSAPAPVYSCENRDPKCPKNTHDCQNMNLGTISGCSDPQDCLMLDYKTGISYCAYPKGSPPSTPCVKQDKTGCTGGAGTQGSCCAGLTCEYYSGTQANTIDGINTTGICHFVPNVGCKDCTGVCKHPTIDAPYTCIPPGLENSCLYGKPCTAPELCLPNPLNNDEYTCLSPYYNKTPCNKFETITSKDGKTTIEICNSVSTGLGIDINTDPAQLIKILFSLLLGIAGGFALILIIASGYQIMVSQGNPEKLQAARERITSAIVGLLFIIFSFVILQVIGTDILGIFK